MLDIGVFMEEGDEVYKNGLDFNIACLLYLSIFWNIEDRVYLVFEGVSFGSVFRSERV